MYRINSGTLGSSKIGGTRHPPTPGNASKRRYDRLSGQLIMRPGVIRVLIGCPCAMLELPIHP